VCTMIASVSGTEVQRRDRMHKRMYSVARDQIMLPACRLLLMRGLNANMVYLYSCTRDRYSASLCVTLIKLGQF
jgi:hypothetical protein